MFSLSTFEHQLVMYVTADDKATFAKAFDISTIPIVSHEQALAEERTKKLTTATPTLKAPSAGPKKVHTNGATDGVTSAAPASQLYSQQLAQIPELKAYGSVLKSSSLIELTESETEYVVSAIKHIFKDHVVLQYEIKNTLPDTVLEQVSVIATPSEGVESLEEDFIVPVAKLATDEPGTVYVAFKKAGDTPFPITSFTNVLKFTSKEIDPTTGEPDESGYDDEYQVEDLELSGCDYVVPAFAGSFDHVWEQTGANGEEASETLQLSNTKSIAGKPHTKLLTFFASSLLRPCHCHCHCDASHLKLHRFVRANSILSIKFTDATEQLIKALSLQPLDGTDVALSSSTHTLKLYGKTLAGGKVAAVVKMAYSAKTGVTTKVSVRSEEEGVAALLVGSVA